MFFSVAPYNPPQQPQPPVSSMQGPGFKSFQDHKPDKAWNDPPMVFKKDKPMVNSPSALHVMVLYTLLKVDCVVANRLTVNSFYFFVGKIFHDFLNKETLGSLFQIYNTFILI